MGLIYKPVKLGGETTDSRGVGRGSQRIDVQGSEQGPGSQDSGRPCLALPPARGQEGSVQT